MPKPCTCTDYVAGAPFPEGGCRTSWLWVNDDAYRQRHGGEPLRDGFRRTLPCVHLGVQVGIQQCPSCTGQVGQKLFACAEPRRLGEPTIIKNCQNCPYHTLLVDVVTVDPARLWPTDRLQKFNCSLIDFGSSTYLAYRDRWGGARVSLAELDAELQPRWSAPLALPRGREDTVGQEDPRLFEFNGRLHVAYTGYTGSVTSACYARLEGSGSDWHVEARWAPQYERRAHWEKNWSYFGHDNRLYAVYQVAPHRVLEIDGDRIMAEYETPGVPRWTGGHLRGGASPVRVGDEYWHFFHGRRDGAGVGGWYSVGVCAFEAQPPFRLTRCTPHPLLEPFDKPTGYEGVTDVVFPGGAVRRGDRWLVSCGWFDHWCKVFTFQHRTIEAALAAV